MPSPEKSTILVVVHLWAGTPQTGPLGFGFLPQPLELAAIGVGEGGGAGESQFDEVLVEEVLVLPVAVRIQVHVSQSPPIGILGVSDPGYLQSNDALGEDALCVVGCPQSFGRLGELRRFVSSSWYEATGRVSEGHLRTGTRVEAVKRWRQATSWAERYVAKPEAFPAGFKTGRVWGVWNGRLLPVRWEKVQVALRDAFRIRRVYRKLARMKGRGPISRITVFVRHENALRLLGYLGYRLE
jgi:hypothetical protein